VERFGDLVQRWLRMTFAGSDLATVLAKYAAILLATGIAFLVIEGASLRISVIAPPAVRDQEPRVISVSGTRTNGMIAGIAVFGIWAAIAAGVTWASAPHLKIVGVESSERRADRRRIIVLNRSSKTIEFSAQLTTIEPDIGHHVPAFLQLTGSESPYRKSSIPGEREAKVDVFLLSLLAPQMGPRLLIANVHLVYGEPRNTEILIPSREHKIQITVFPVHPSEGSPDSRFFRIVPKSDGDHELEMLPRGGAMKDTLVGIAWLFGGLVPMPIGYAVAGLLGYAIGGLIGVYLVWYAMKYG
jgi:hypothetical protein